MSSSDRFTDNDENGDYASDEHDSGCPECGAGTTVDRYEVVCSVCSLVVRGAMADPEDERTWQQSRSGDVTNHRTQAATVVRHDKGLGSCVGNQRDEPGKRYYHELDPSTGNIRKVRHPKTLRDIHERTCRPTNTNALQYALSEVAHLVAQLHLPIYVHTEAARVLHGAHENNEDADLFRQYKPEVCAAGAVGIAAAVHRTPREWETIAEHTDFDSHTIQRTQMLIRSKTCVRKDDNPSTRLVKPRDFVPRYAAAVAGAVDDEPDGRHLPSVLATNGEALLAEAMDADPMIDNGRNATSLAAAAVYLAGQSSAVSISQRLVAEVLLVSRRAISERSRDIRNALE
ncbi:MULTISPECIES: transcription initiation factor IIB family protein [Natrialbaceae]|uniref:hypothetical protein n=1 Tax=Natrialbaceae TaxID=1644061 RepID=UPI00207C636D|nr:hypothetical protein [Natronococcus sp. CG52]